MMNTKEKTYKNSYILIRRTGAGTGKKNKNYFICTVTCDNACDGDTDHFFTWKTER